MYRVQCTVQLHSVHGVRCTVLQSPKFKRVSLDKTHEFTFWGFNICVNFDFRDLKKIENINKLNKIIIQNKNIDIRTTV